MKHDGPVRKGQRCTGWKIGLFKARTAVEIPFFRALLGEEDPLSRLIPPGGRGRAAYNKLDSRQLDSSLRTNA
jgi:hypothetical protein